MLIANAEHDGQQKVLISESGNVFVDFTKALHIWNQSQSADPGLEVGAGSIQQLLDTGRFNREVFQTVLSFIGSQRALNFNVQPGEFRLRAPFSRPGQIIALARNYQAHAEESTLPIPNEPIFFSKANTSVIGPGEEIILPPNLNLGRIEPEIELAVVIKKEAWHVPAAAAEQYIAGYTILNDVSAQELQVREIKEGYPLFRCKSLRTFTPMGPFLLTVEEIGVNPALNMTLRVNGKPRVFANTGGLTFGIPRLIEFISGYIVLRPGDVISTGCPKAAGAIQPGDEITLEIEKIGVLRNTVVAGKDPCPQ